MPVLAPALVTLRRQVDDRFPGRRTTSDGWIADDRHRAGGATWRTSQHIENGADVVCALDITEDLAVGLDCGRLLDELDASGDPRLFYAIHDRQIENSNDTRTPYTGANGHVTHCHVSTPPDRSSLYLDDRPWDLPMLTGRAPATPPRPSSPAPAWAGPDLIGRGVGLRGDVGNSGPRVRALQRSLRRSYPAYAGALADDGVWGPRTSAVLREFAHRTARGMRAGAGRTALLRADGRNIGPQIAGALHRAGFRP